MSGGLPMDGEFLLGRTAQILGFTLAVAPLLFIAIQTIRSEEFRREFSRTLRNTVEIFAEFIIAASGLKSKSDISQEINRLNLSQEKIKSELGDFEKWLKQNYDANDVKNGTEDAKTRENIASLAREIEKEVQRISELKKSEASRYPEIEVIDDAIFKLQSVLSTLTVRGFINLVIGISFSVSALYLLKEAVEILSPDQISKLTMPAATYFVGVRISLVGIITAISYFFLALYKKSIDESKYYQNEITNLLQKKSAMHFLNSNNIGNAKIFTILTLMSDDRNSSHSSGDSERQNPDGASRYIDILINRIMSQDESK